MTVVDKRLNDFKHLGRIQVVKEGLLVVDPFYQGLQKDAVLSVVDAGQAAGGVDLEKLREGLIVVELRDLVQDLIPLLDCIGYTV
jgi:hypothetical protein